MFLLLALTTASLAAPTDLSGPVLAAELSGVGAPSSCGAFVPGVRLGYRFDRPFVADRPWGLAAVARPEVGVRGLPCGGATAFGGGRLGLRAGPMELGVYGHFGAAAAFPTDQREATVDPNAGFGVAVSVVTLPVEVTVHTGYMVGYFGQGWLELGAMVGVRF